MYEEISVKREINWKSLFFKVGILILVVFIVCAVALTPRSSNAATPYKNLADKVLEAGKKYYTDSKLPNSLGNSNSINLAKLIENDLLKENDYKNNKCDLDSSYVKVTKVGDNEYSIYVYLLCNDNEEVVGDSITTKDNNKAVIEQNKAEDNKSAEGNVEFNDNEKINVTVED